VVARISCLPLNQLINRRPCEVLGRAQNREHNTRVDGDDEVLTQSQQL
jgi:hypothetical protein